MMEVEELSSGYGRIGVLEGVSLSVGAGECVGILGHNGMGKSTLMRAIMGLLPAWTGRIVFDGKPIQKLPAYLRARAGLALVPQGRMIFPGLSVRDNLRFGAAAKGAEDIEAALTDFPELRRLLDRPGGALSGGEQQLLALARALCGQPRLLLLDEPTEGIQPSIVEAIIERIGHLRVTRGLSVLLVEQNLDFIRGLAERVLVIQRGRIVRQLSQEAVRDPALEHEFIGT
jgi:urea ABC transporter ATP-binding protein UrtE